MSALVVVAYGDPATTATCLATLAAGDAVVVVDNGLDDAVAALAADHGARYLRPSRNVGFGAAVNLALAAMPGEDVVLVNPDALVPPAAWRALLGALTGDVAAAAPLLANTDGSVQRTEWPMPTPARCWLAAVGLSDRWQHRTFLSGAVLALSGRALAEVGDFDERFFLYSEETDWQQRALRAGWRTRLVGSVTVTHVGAATSSDPVRREALFHAGGETYLRRWYGPAGWQVGRAGSLLAALRRAALASGAERRHHLRVARLYLRGPRRVAFGASALPPAPVSRSAS